MRTPSEWKVLIASGRRGALADQRRRPLAHLGRGLVGEGDRRDLPGA
jgi:hypothetical protein